MNECTVLYAVHLVMSCANYDSFSTRIPFVTPADPDMVEANECFLSNANIHFQCCFSYQNKTVKVFD